MRAGRLDGRARQPTERPERAGAVDAPPSLDLAPRGRERGTRREASPRPRRGQGRVGRLSGRMVLSRGHGAPARGAGILSNRWNPRGTGTVVGYRTQHARTVPKRTRGIQQTMQRPCIRASESWGLSEASGNGKNAICRAAGDRRARRGGGRRRGRGVVPARGPARCRGRGGAGPTVAGYRIAESVCGRGRDGASGGGQHQHGADRAVLGHDADEPVLRRVPGDAVRADAGEGDRIRRDRQPGGLHLDERARRAGRAEVDRHPARRPDVQRDRGGRRHGDRPGGRADSGHGTARRAARRLVVARAR